MNPGDVAIGVLAGAVETKARPAVVIASNTHLAERPDALIGILTTKLPTPVTTQIIFSGIGNPLGFEPSRGLAAETLMRAVQES